MHAPDHLALFGGTFDPIHLGHTMLANRLIETLHFSKLILIPNKTPPHRAAPTASEHDRLAMIERAIAPYPNMAISSCELDRDGPSYTRDTLQHFRAQDPDQPISFILGADMFNCLNTWHDWQALLTLAHCIVLNRPDHPLTHANWAKTLLAQHQTTTPDMLCTQPAGKIYIFETDPIPISATAIRAKLKRGESISALVDPAVADYIHTHRLYT